MVVFGIAWAATFGRHHLWILPNLTEDVGFLESFWPLYKHEYKPKGGSGDDSEGKEDEKGKEEEEDSGEKAPLPEQERDSEAESVATTESRNANGFEILDSNNLNEE